LAAVAEVYVFDAKLDAYSGGEGKVTRRLALRGEESLIALHRLIQEAFGWDDDHLYSFWLDGRFWGDRESEYTAPFGREEIKSARIQIDELRLEPGRRIVYIFDFGDEWRVSLRLRETCP